MQQNAYRETEQQTALLHFYLSSDHKEGKNITSEKNVDFIRLPPSLNLKPFRAQLSQEVTIPREGKKECFL